MNFLEVINFVYFVELILLSIFGFEIDSTLGKLLGGEDSKFD